MYSLLHSLHLTFLLTHIICSDCIQINSQIQLQVKCTNTYSRRNLLAISLEHIGAFTSDFNAADVWFIQGHISFLYCKEIVICNRFTLSTWIRSIYIQWTSASPPALKHEMAILSMLFFDNKLIMLHLHLLAGTSYVPFKISWFSTFISWICIDFQKR